MNRTPQTRDSIAAGIWRACHILRRDNNCGGVMEYVEHLAWLLFLRFLDAQKTIWAQEAQIHRRSYACILGGCSAGGIEGCDWGGTRRRARTGSAPASGRCLMNGQDRVNLRHASP